MTDKEQMLLRLKIDALWAYLELCNTIKEVPKKEIYDALKECKELTKLEESTQLIEKQHGEFLKNK